MANLRNVIEKLAPGDEVLITKDQKDESGKIVAHVIPAFNPDDWEPVPPPELSEEELKKRENSSRWYTSDEVRRHLESL